MTTAMLVLSLWTVPTPGIVITGLEQPLIVGQSANLSCITNELASFIEWKNQTLMINATNVTALNYPIPLVTDEMQGETLTCTATVSNTRDTERVMLIVTGTTLSVWLL